jgi:hypothetical protein
MSSMIPNTQTLCLKGVPMAHAKAIVAAVEREARPTHGITHTPDREPGRGSEFLVYANYASARDAQRARDGVEAWVRDKWPEQWGRRPQVLLKAELQDVHFALYVDGAPPGTQPRELEDMFAEYGRLHATKICAIKSSDNAYFVNYCDYDGALAALEAARCRSLRFKGAILYANAARNTTFLVQLTADLRASGRFSFSLDDAKRVGKNMASSDWPPQESSIERLLTAARQHFVPDRKAKQFHLMDRNAPLAPAPAQTPPLVSPPRSPSPPLSGEEEEERAKRAAAMHRFVNDSFELLHELFLTLWFQAKVEVWVDSEGWASSSAEELKVELNRSELPPQMLKPVADWDLPSLATALTATSLKARLQSMHTGARGAGEHDPTSARWMVLVDEHIMSEEDLTQKYGPMFAASHYNAWNAVLTVRAVRNLLSHLPGSVKGLSQASFECFCGLTSEALSVLANVLGGDHLARLTERRTALFGSLGEPTGSRVGSPSSPCGGDTGRFLPADDSLTLCSSAARPTSPRSGLDLLAELSEFNTEHSDVRSWGVEQVLAFFERCKFPTEGVQSGEVDGESLVNLYQDPDAESLFTAPAPDGLGFNKLMFKGRFKKEMEKLVAKPSVYAFI